MKKTILSILIPILFVSASLPAIACDDKPCKQAHLAEIAKGKKDHPDLQDDEQYMTMEALLEELKEDPMLMHLGTDDDSTLQYLYDSLLGSNMGTFLKIEMLMTNQDFTGALALNSSIIPSNLPEQNQKTVNDIYLNTYAIGTYTFDSLQQELLKNIIYQNPVYGGKAVYSARVMLDIDVDDFVNTGSTLAKMEAQDEAENTGTIPPSSLVGKLYPNPNNGYMQLDYSLTTGQTGTLTIFDISGKKINSYSLPAENTSLQIKESTLQNGIYFYQITIDNKIISSDKLVIIK